MKHPTSYRTIQVDGLKIFYREAGPKDAPTILLLHGYPPPRGCSSRCSPGCPIAIVWSRRITRASAKRWPDRKAFHYTFDHLAGIVDDFTQQLGFRVTCCTSGLRRPVGIRLPSPIPNA